ncbi:lyso-ornithine lipid acyltransferase [Bryocella elongata]|uniref:Lyso-ornithine lipid acyltransferase n=1 Tax=Bryocella elongata TaxID=863522 RepID=A0A1H6BXF8_9BACT|nr:lysophospholipid acyltransferase family protein [Bryocella elongata]SEG65394.1 lyso-ornithine lipid acyltransferase [Bryocella elongata]
MIFFRRIFRLVAIGWMFVYSIAELLITRPKSRPERAAWLTRFCGRVLRATSIHIHATGPIPTEGAVISNHLTIVDILSHSALRPCVFVSKAELREVPLIGWISMMAGTVYVVRGGGGSAQKAAQGMAKGFRDGLPVTFFPEGGTFMGDEPVMPFRSGLLAESLAAQAKVTPSFIRYELTPGDIAAGRTPREDVYLGERSLPNMVWSLVGLERLDVHIVFAGHAIDFPPEAYEDRKIAAVIAHAIVLELSGTTADRTGPTASVV